MVNPQIRGFLGRFLNTQYPELILYPFSWSLARDEVPYFGIFGGAFPSLRNLWSNVLADGQSPRRWIPQVVLSSGNRGPYPRTSVSSLFAYASASLEAHVSFFLGSNYVDQATALAQNLTYSSGDTFIIRADHTTTLSASGPGRNSVRIQSNKQYFNHVTV